MKIQSQKENDELEQSNGTLSVDLADKEKQIRMAIREIGRELIPLTSCFGKI